MIRLIVFVYVTVSLTNGFLTTTCTGKTVQSNRYGRCPLGYASLSYRLGGCCRIDEIIDVPVERNCTRPLTHLIEGECPVGSLKVRDGCCPNQHIVFFECPYDRRIVGMGVRGKCPTGQTFTAEGCCRNKDVTKTVSCYEDPESGCLTKVEQCQDPEMQDILEQECPHTCGYLCGEDDTSCSKANCTVNARATHNMFLRGHVGRQLCPRTCGFC